MNRRASSPRIRGGHGVRRRPGYVDTMSAQANSGAGNRESNPATAANPPSHIEAGDQKRDPEGSGAHRADMLIRRVRQFHQI
jgi:hypothetical protein